MAQKRLLDRKISVSDQVSNLPLEAQLIFTWSICHADDVGLLPSSLKTLKATIVPMMEISLETFAFQVEKILAQGLWIPFSYLDHTYYRIVKFNQSQTLKKDRQPMSILPIKLEEKPIKSWEKLQKLLNLEDVGFQAEDNGFHLEPEEKRREEKSIVADATQSVPSEISPGKAEPFSFQAYLDKMLTYKQRHIQVIGIYWQFKGFKMPTLEATKASLTRELRPAKALIGYTDDQIVKTMEFLDNDPKRDYVWTLETIGKRINNVINNRN